MKSRREYECPRCLFKTMRRQVMKNHFNRKVVCPPVRIDISLSDSIKECVLSNYVFKDEGVTISHVHKTVIKNYNYMLNVINTNFNCLQLVDTFKQVKQISITPFDDYLNEIFKEENAKFDANMDIEMKIEDFQNKLGTISAVIDGINFQDMNLFYDREDDTLNIYDEDQWKTSVIGCGMKSLIERVQSYHLDYYECLIINKIERAIHADVKQHLRDVLKEYYRFLAVFDVKPYCNNKFDYYILECEYDETAQRVAKEYTSFYNNIKSELKLNETKALRKSTIEIIKRRSASWLQVIKNMLCTMASESLEIQDKINGMLSSPVYLK